MRDGLEAQRASARAMWSAGHYPTVAGRLRPVALRLVAQAGIGAGDRVLDVGAGSGSVSVVAAARGAIVSGIDIVDTWFPVARAAAAAAGVPLDLAVGDAEDLPYPDHAFDVVVSNFAHIFAPRHAVVAAEMARVCRPGGTLAFSAWTGPVEDDAFAVIGRALAEAIPGPDPEPRDGASGGGAGPGGGAGSREGRPGAGAGTGDGGPRAWGRPGYAIARFAEHGVDLRVQHHVLRWDFPSEDALWDFLLTASGPYVKAREALEALGTWEPVLAEARARTHAANQAADGSYVLEQPYLIASGTRRSSRAGAAAWP